MNSTVFRLIVLAALTGIAAALSFGYLGRLHPALDSFSHFRVHLAGLLLILVPVLLLVRLRIEALFAVLLGGLTLGTTLWEGAGATPAHASGAVAGPVYKVLHLNVYYRNERQDAVLSLIGEVRPDVVMLNEVSARWHEKIRLLEGAYPYTLICPKPDDLGGTAILSRRPFATGFHPQCGARGDVAHLRYDFGGPTAIIAGDLNSAPWSYSARSLADAAGARILRGLGSTYLHRIAPDWLRRTIGLPIDHVMVKGAVVPVKLQTIEGGNSDHLPVLFEFTLLPEEKPAEVRQAAVRE
jgi:endonuclease/exonuclease/phosphatase (EEP) superfamily protein YafD